MKQVRRYLSKPFGFLFFIAIFLTLAITALCRPIHGFAALTCTLSSDEPVYNQSDKIRFKLSWETDTDLGDNLAYFWLLTPNGEILAPTTDLASSPYDYSSAHTHIFTGALGTTIFHSSDEPGDQRRLSLQPSGTPTTAMNSITLPMVP